VDDFGGAEEGEEGGEVAGEDEAADDSSEGHGGVLAVAPALLVVPGEVGGEDLDGGGLGEVGAEAPVDGDFGGVHGGELQDAAQGVEDEVADGGPVGEAVAHFEPEGGEEAEGQRLLRGGFGLHRQLRRRRRRRRGAGERDAGRVEGLPAVVRREGFDLVEAEAGAAFGQAAAGHALDGEDGVGLELDGLAEEEEVEGERIAGRETAGAAARLEDVGAHDAG